MIDRECRKDEGGVWKDDGKSRTGRSEEAEGRREFAVLEQCSQSLTP